MKKALNRFLNIFTKTGGAVKTEYRRTTRFYNALGVSVLIHIGVFTYLYFFQPQMLEDAICYVTGERPQTDINIELSTDASEKKPEEQADQQTKQQGKPGAGDDKLAKLQDTFNENKMDFPHENKHEKLVRRLRQNHQLKKKFRRNLKNIFPKGDPRRPPGAYIRRKHDYDDIVVKEVLPSIYTIHKNFKDLLTESPDILAEHKERNEIIRDFRAWKKGDTLPGSIGMNWTLNEEAEKGKGQKKPLAWSGQQRLAFFDRTIKLKKESQMNYFINRFIKNHDPNDGDLPIAIRELYEKNMQRLAIPFSRDRTHFILDYFQENLNKEDYLQNSLALVSELKGSKSATELLFTLENIYEIQGRAASHIIEMQKHLEALPPDRFTELRIQVILRVVNRYKKILREKGIYTRQDAHAAYSQRQMQVLDYIIETSPAGYRVADAKFEKARILWEKGLRSRDDQLNKQAIQIFNSLNAEGKDFRSAKTLTLIRPHLKGFLSKDVRTRVRSKANIQRALARRIDKYLRDKRKREMRLLWGEEGPAT